MEIRQATQSDLARILQLHQELEFGATPVLNLMDAQQIFNRMQSYPDYHLYVAEIEGLIVGTFALLIMENLAHSGAPSGIVEDVVVHPQWQGQGIGKAMMQFAMQKCSQAGCYKLCLSSNLKRAAAHRFYESLGFQQHGYSYKVDF